jgi:hypothetical protein
MKIHHEGILFKLRLLSPAFACFRLLSPAFACFRVVRSVLLLLCLVTGSITLSAQYDEDCLPITTTNCGNLSIVIARMEQNLVVDNCPNPADTQNDPSRCTNVNTFHQMPYRVYLKYTPPPPPPPTIPPVPQPTYEPFYLNYAELNVYVRLFVQNLVVPTLSRIDMESTQSCFEDNYPFNKEKVIFKLDPCTQGVSFNLFNDGSGGVSSILNCAVVGDNSVLFKYGYIKPTGPSPVDPTGLGSFVESDNGVYNPNYAYYAMLFPIIVNAYPGEEIAFTCDYTDNNLFCIENNTPITPTAKPNFYKSFTTPVDTCTIIGCSTTPGSFTALAATTENTDLELQVINDNNNVSTGTAHGFDVKLKNNSTKPQNIKFLEFTLKISSPGTLYTPEAISGAVPIISKNGGDYFLRYVVNFQTPVTISAGADYLISEIIAIRPWPYNLISSAALTFHQSSKYKVQTDNTCDKLLPQTNPNPVTSSLGIGTTCSGDPNYGQIKLKAEIIGSGGSCPSQRLQIGLFSEAPPQQVSISQLFVRLKFETATAPGISLASPSCYVFDCNGKGCMTAGNDLHTYNSTSKVLDICLSGQNFLALTPDAYIIFNIANVDLQPDDIIIEEARIDYATTPAFSCVPVCVVSRTDKSNDGIRGSLKTEAGVVLEDATVNIKGEMPASGACPNPGEVEVSSVDGTDYNYKGCLCGEYGTVTITPVENDNYINGVSTFDLVLISKHILGIEVLNSPYKMIAADANKSNSITTFDIVELRKLILGVYTELPNIGSWRFVDKAYNLPANPFAPPAFPETRTLNNVVSADMQDFVAIKIGDLNGNAVANSKPANRPTTSIAWEMQSASAKGHTLLVPIRYTGADMLEAIQLGLRFDPDKLKLKGTVIGEVPGFLPENFNLAEADKGILKANWVLWADALQIKPGQVLFYLNFEVKDALPEDATSLLQLDDNLMENIAWRTDDQEFSLQYQAQGKTSALPEMLQNELFSVRCFPNPGSGFAQFGINTRQGGKYRVSLNDAVGQRLLLQDLYFSEAGEQTLQLQGSEKLPNGVYLWRVWNSTHKLQGIWIKQ